MKAQIDDMMLEMLNSGRDHCTRAGTSLTALGIAIVNDGKFFHDLSKPGKTCTIKTYRKVMGWFQENAQGVVA